MIDKWDAAPTDATHWGPKTRQYNECWYKNELGIWWFRKPKMRQWMPMNQAPSIYRFGKMEKRP